MECVDALRERRPEVFDVSASSYLSWRLQNALADDRPERASELVRELAPRAGDDIDVFNRTAAVLSYHGQLSALVEALRIAWTGVNSSNKIVPWGVPEFAQNGVVHEFFDYIEHSTHPDPTDPLLLDRIRFFFPNVREDSVRTARRPDRQVRPGLAD